MNNEDAAMAPIEFTDRDIQLIYSALSVFSVFLHSSTAYKHLTPEQHNFTVENFHDCNRLIKQLKSYMTEQSIEIDEDIAACAMEW
jgi:hypothetical protein